MKLILIILTFCFVCSCHRETKKSPESELREAVRIFFSSKNDTEIRAMIFSPKGMNSKSIDRMVKEQVAIRSILVQPIEISSTVTRGNWAKISFQGQLAGGTGLVAYRQNNKWLFLADSVGSYLWGKQPWHTRLSQKDQDDYKTIREMKITAPQR